LPSPDQAAAAWSASGGGNPSWWTSQIIKGAQRFSRRELASVEAAEAELADEPYKLELIRDKRPVVGTRLPAEVCSLA